MAAEKRIRVRRLSFYSILQPDLPNPWSNHANISHCRRLGRRTVSSGGRFRGARVLDFFTLAYSFRLLVWNRPPLLTFIRQR